MESEDTYHYDFTTASELEIFIARLEEIIQEWQLPQRTIESSLKKNDFKTKEWCTSCEKITFAEVEFQLVRYYLKNGSNDDEKADEKETSRDLEDEGFSQALDDMLSLENDFFPITIPPAKDSHPLARWYGLRDFLVLTPKMSVSVTTESQIKLWLSSICIATSNTGCQVPFFLQAKEPWQCYFLGVCQSKGYHTDFEMVHLKQIPIHYRYLTGLLTLFKSKLGAGLINAPITISVRFTYTLRDWALSTWPQSPPDLDFLQGEDVGASELSKLPFGSVYDPIQGLHLNATWPELIENTVIDGESFSDLDPMKAPVWTASIIPVYNTSCLLTDYFVEFVALNGNTHTMHEILGNLVEKSSGKAADLSSSLSAITESKISALSKAVIGSDRSSRKQSKQVESAEGPIPSDILKLILYYLFPDADAEMKSAYPDQYSGTAVTSIEEDRPVPGLDPRLNGMKSAPYNSLPWRLAHVMAHVIHSLGGVQSAMHLWYEFTQELRFRCENSILVPGLELTFPDPRTCLLNQKLQLLNCCISRKIDREKRAKKQADEDSESDEDEFYDCSSDTEAPGDDSGSRRRGRTGPCDKPMGRSARHGELRLLETGEYLYIPKTQDPIPKTEDQLEEDAEVLVQLGTDAHGSELRARLMSASLLSDMEAFKAANPGCVLADFIRWYSPRDWIEDDGLDDYGQRKGRLSNRMQIPGNTWLEVWEIAKPVPTKWQRRLFNDTREAEKVLHYLEHQTPRGFVELLLPVLSVAVIQKILEESVRDDLIGVPEMITKLIKKTERLQRSPNSSADRYKDLVDDVCAIETLLVQANFLKRKFLPSGHEESSPEDYHEVIMGFIKNLLTGAETEVPGEPRSRLRSAIRYYFVEASKVEQMKPDKTSALTDSKWKCVSSFPSPCEKEMILRCSTSKGPQRLHAVLMKNDFRLCGAFTKDNTFF